VAGSGMCYRATSRVIHRKFPCILCSVRTMCIALLHEYMYACACPTSIPSVREQNNACCRWCMWTCECVWAARWVCTRASQHVGACILLFCDMQRTLGTLVLVTFVGLLVIASAVILTIPSPTTLGPNITSVLFPS